MLKSIINFRRKWAPHSQASRRQVVRDVSPALGRLAVETSSDGTKIKVKMFPEQFVRDYAYKTCPKRSILALLKSEDYFQKISIK
jgi:hypothetical protein